MSATEVHDASRGAAVGKIDIHGPAHVTDSGSPEGVPGTATGATRPRERVLGKSDH